MRTYLKIHKRLSSRLIFWIALTLFCCIFAWAYLNIKQQNKNTIQYTSKWADNLASSAKIAVGYAMMLKPMGDIDKILYDIAAQGGVDSIRVYDKKGEVKFSSHRGHTGERLNVNSHPCTICHESRSPAVRPGLAERVRLFQTPAGDRLLGITTPVFNRKGCDVAGCHKPVSQKKVLGVLSMSIPLREVDEKIVFQKWGWIFFALVVFILMTSMIVFFIKFHINRPVKNIISRMEDIVQARHKSRIEVESDDEIGELASAINQMTEQISEKQAELNKNREEYQNLFENSPCYITVQDRDFKLLKYNREFADKFEPEVGDYCYHAYKGRFERCEICPVLGTFQDGNPRTSEETGVNKDGTRSFWMVRTSPIKNSRGEVVAAMEMSLDVTHMKFLENEVRKSEQKYRTIFNTISNPIFVLDRKTLGIMDCNESVTEVYGYDKDEMLKMSFLDFFNEEERPGHAEVLKEKKTLSNIKHTRKNGSSIYVNIYISPSEYMEKEVLLVIANDITDRLIAEQQLIQASKMSTLGEMATGIAHELNQPLSVIKTACGFLLKKVRNKEPVKDSIMEELASEMDSYVNRASKIINHMREFGRQSGVKKTTVNINEALEKALEIFSQQLKLREIEVVKDLEKDLPPILADSNRLEQVFINLLTNARDAIEDKAEQDGSGSQEKKIFLKTVVDSGFAVVEIRDTGSGVPDSIREKIYDPFFTTKKAGVGTGLGLSISYGIVQDYGGTIRLKSKEGEGCAFIINFPIPDTGIER